MKKIISAVICTVMAILNISVVSFAENTEVEGLHEKLNELFIENHFTEEEIANIKSEWMEYFEDSFWNEILPSLKALGKMETESDEQEYEYWLNFRMPDFSRGVCVSIVQTNKYMAQYGAENKLNYLFSEEYCWEIFGEFRDALKCTLKDDGTRIANQVTEFDGKYPGIVLKNEAYDFLHNENEIKNMLLSKNENVVRDIKIFSPWHGISLLYIKCEQNEYVIKLYAKNHDEQIPSIEKYKLYTVAEVMKAVISKEEQSYIERQNLIRQVEQVKPTYETEAEALQQAGLLQGNENGLDLLKPLTRAEAVTLLIRAMGLEDQTVNYPVSQFADIASDNWASPYAALAKAEGITNGVSETEFAPDDRVTADQFATFALRAAGESDFDYTQGTQILIDRGIITAEQAETMDLFTRGDMAKIIYEAREKGLL